MLALEINGMMRQKNNNRRRRKNPQKDDITVSPRIFTMIDASSSQTDVTDQSQHRAIYGRTCTHLMMI
jgi:hypothetical protein